MNLSNRSYSAVSFCSGSKPFVPTTIKFILQFNEKSAASLHQRKNRSEKPQAAILCHGWGLRHRDRWYKRFNTLNVISLQTNLFLIFEVRNTPPLLLMTITPVVPEQFFFLCTNIHKGMIIISLRHPNRKNEIYNTLIYKRLCFYWVTRVEVRKQGIMLLISFGEPFRISFPKIYWMLCHRNSSTYFFSTSHSIL